MMIYGPQYSASSKPSVTLKSGNGSNYGASFPLNPNPFDLFEITAPSSYTPGIYVYNGTTSKWVPVDVAQVPYDVAMGYTSKPAASQLIGKINLVRPIVVPAAFAGSIATVETAPVASAVFSIRINDAEIGTITFAAGAKSGTFTGPASKSMWVATNSLSIVAPAVADAALSGLSVTLNANQLSV